MAGALVLAVAGCGDAASDAAREAVAVVRAMTGHDPADHDGRRVWIGVESCNAEGLAVAVDATAAEVRVSASRLAAPSAGGDGDGEPGGHACMDGRTIVLDEPLGDRRVVDASTGREVPVDAVPDAAP